MDPLEKTSSRKYLLLLLGIHLLILFLRIIYIQSGALELHSEEAQYWIWSKHLQLSYYSKPPLVAYMNWFSTELLGNTELGIRINAIGIGFLISMVTYFFCLELFGNTRKAFIASLLTYAMPFIQINSLFFLTDSPLLLFWLLSLFFFWRAAQRNRTFDWIAFGISMGLGILAKYAILFLIPCLLWCAWQSDKRLLHNRKFYASMAFALLFLVPIVIWNVQQNFIGLKHLVHLSGVNSGPRSFHKELYNILEYLLGQILILSPFFFGFYIALFRKKNRMKSPGKILFLAFPPLMVFAVFLVIALIRRSGVNINWPVFAYATVPILLAHYSVENRKMMPLLIGFVLTIFFSVSVMNLPELDELTGKQIIHPKNDPVKRFTGWKTLANRIDEISSSFPKDSCFYFSTNYHITSEMGFYLSGKPSTYFVNLNSRMTQFDLWQGVEQYKDSDCYAVYVSYLDITDDLLKSFDRIVSVQHCPITYRNQQIRNFRIYVLKGFHGISQNHNSY